MRRTKIQPVNYRDVEDLLAQLPEKQKEVVLFLRALILDTLPEVREKLSYSVP